MFFGDRGFGQVDYPFAGAIGTSIPVAGGWEPGCWVGSCYTGGRCGGHGCGRNCSWVGSSGGSAGNTGWHILVSAQGVSVIGIVEIYCMPVEIKKVSMTFII